LKYPLIILTSDNEAQERNEKALITEYGRKNKNVNLIKQLMRETLTKRREYIQSSTDSIENLQFKYQFFNSKEWVS
jgi:excinuclease UvrABC helicase subunit UvrB